MAGRPGCATQLPGRSNTSRSTQPLDPPLRSIPGRSAAAGEAATLARLGSVRVRARERSVARGLRHPRSGLPFPIRQRIPPHPAGFGLACLGGGPNADGADAALRFAHARRRGLTRTRCSQHRARRTPWCSRREISGDPVCPTTAGSRSRIRSLIPGAGPSVCRVRRAPSRISTPDSNPEFQPRPTSAKRPGAEVVHLVSGADLRLGLPQSELFRPADRLQPPAA